ncbi:phage head morphogenesis protein [Acinetobacter haemolyticus]|uniref:phage head morphogenesis protein n=1 Tax=Acinetobacter haemolyticus TaxID=29430 RepID=UPI0021CD26F9|nr:phage minor head protein [Acinetobacter haemolyticus]MCU4378267.1 phage head morphogenesis protein [Acinetobacter haemolyticus]
MANIPSRPELNALFNSPPEDAIAYLKSKGFKIGWDWHETLDEAHSRAFTVAKVARIDLLQDIRKSLITALEQGQNLDQWKAAITPTLQQKGWWGKQTLINPEGIEQTVQLGSPRRLKTIFDTNVHKSLAAGRYKALMATVDTRPLWEWVHISITNPRKVHLARNGETRRYDDPFWLYAYPPTEFGCKCKVRARRSSDVENHNLKMVETKPEDIEQHQVVIGKSSFTGQDAIATQTRIRVRQADGQVTYFTPAAGFNSHPASSYLLDVELTKRAADLLGADKALQEVQLMLLSQPRLKAHEAFVKNSISFGKQQNKTSTVGVIDMRDIKFLTEKNVAVESPILTISDHLLVGQKAKRHGEAGNAPTFDEWMALPRLIPQVQQVIWDVDNQSMLYLLPALQNNSPNEVIKLSIRSKNGVMEIVSIFKIKDDVVAGSLQGGVYEKIR